MRFTIFFLLNDFPPPSRSLEQAMHMCEVLARPWVGVCVPLALSLS